MNLIDSVGYKNEKQTLKEWASSGDVSSKNDSFDNFKDVFADTYYSDYDNSSDICKYGFDDVNQLTKMLSALWEDDEQLKEIAIICSIAAYKAKEAELFSCEVEDDYKNVKEIQVPDYIYAM